MSWDEYWKKLDSLKDVYDFFQKSHFKEYETLIKTANIRNFEFAEFGAGNGSISDLIQKRFNATGSLFDNSKQAHALFKASHAGKNRKLKYFVKDINKLNGGKAYDLVFSDGLIEHFKGRQKEKILKQHFNLTKKGGFAIIFAPRKSLKYDSIFHTMRLCGLWCFGFEKPMTMTELEKETEAAGFKITKKLRGFWENGVLVTKE